MRKESSNLVLNYSNPSDHDKNAYQQYQLELLTKDVREQSESRILGGCISEFPNID
jgi:hypothetical protein